MANRKFHFNRYYSQICSNHIYQPSCVFSWEAVYRRVYFSPRQFLRQLASDVRRGARLTLTFFTVARIPVSPSHLFSDRIALFVRIIFCSYTYVRSDVSFLIDFSSISSHWPTSLPEKVSNDRHTDRGQVGIEIVHRSQCQIGYRRRICISNVTWPRTLRAIRRLFDRAFFRSLSLISRWFHARFHLSSRFSSGNAGKGPNSDRISFLARPETSKTLKDLKTVHSSSACCPHTHTHLRSHVSARRGTRRRWTYHHTAVAQFDESPIFRLVSDRVRFPKRVYGRS